MKKQPSTSYLLKSITALVLLALMANPALAANATWTGTAGDGNWNTDGSGGNWGGWAAPGISGTSGNSDTATFTSGGAGNTVTVTDSVTNRALGNIVFNNTGSLGNFVIGSSSNNLYFSEHGGVSTMGTYSSGSPVSETINSNLLAAAVTDNQDMEIVTSTGFVGTLTLAGTVANNVGGIGQLLIQTSSSNSVTAGDQSTNVIVFSGVIRNNVAGGGGGQLAVIREDNGVVDFTGANIYTAGFQQGTGGNSANAITEIGVNSVLSGSTLVSGAFGTGTTRFDAGTIESDGTTARTIYNNIVWVSSGKTIVLGNATNNGLLTFAGAVDMGSAFTETIQTNSNVVMSGIFSDTGSLTKTGAATLTLSGANTYSGSTTVSAGTLDLMNSLALQDSTLTTAGIVFDAAATGSGTAFTFGGLSGSSSISLLNNAGTPAAVTLSVGNNNANTTYSGSLSGTGGAVSKIGTGTLTLSGANSYTGATTIENGALVTGTNVAVSTNGAFGNAASAIALGDANSLSNSYAPTLLISTGGVSVARAITVGFASGANSSVYTIGSSNTSGIATYTGGITLNQAVTLQAATGGTTDFSSAVGWTPGVNAITIGSSGNTGTVELDSAISTSGGITVSYGTLVLDNAFTSGTMTVGSGAALGGTGSVAGTVGVTSGTVNGSGLTWTAGATFNSSGNTLSGIDMGNITVASGGVVTQTGTLTGSVSYGGGTSTFGGVIAGNTNTLTVSAGLLTLNGSNANSYAGTTSVSGGELDLSKTGGALAVDGTTINVSGTGLLKLVGSNQILSTATVNVSGGEINFNGQSQTLANVVNTGGTVIYGGAGGTGTVTVNDPTWSTGTNTVSGATVFTDTLVVSGGTNAITGGTTGGQGILALQGSPTAVAFSGSGSPTITINGDATLPGIIELEGNVTTDGASTATIATTAGTDSGELDLYGGNRTFTITGATANPGLLISAKIIDSQGGGAITETGPGSLKLTGANTFAGGTTVSQGTLIAANNSALGSSTGVNAGVLLDPTVGNTATIDFTSATPAIASLASSGAGTSDVVLGNASTPAATALSVGGNNASTSFGGLISDANTGTGAIGSLTKTGSGTFTLTNANTYSGGTTVSAGTLMLGNGTSGSATGSGALSVGSSGTIGGIGTSASGNHGFGIAGKVVAGSGLTSDTTGVTTITGTATLNNSNITGATLSFNLNSANTNSTSINVGSTGVDFVSTPTLSLTLQGNHIIAADTLYVLIAGVNSGSLSGVDGSQYTGITTDSAGTDGAPAGEYRITGGLTLSFTNSLAGTYYANSFLILNTTGGVDDIDVEVVPEPGTWALMLSGLAVLIFWQRSRR